MLTKSELVAAIKQLAGTDRVLIYDVPEAEAPERANPASPFIRGSSTWWDFVRRRRSLDDGENLTLLVSLRGLRADERMLIVNWGTFYANTFLLIEPADPWLDLTTDAGLEELRKAHPDEKTALGFVRAAYAEWVYWSTTAEGDTESRMATLDLGDPGSHLWDTMWDRLPKTFTPAAYLSSLTLLNLRESELFTGGREVRRALMPFLTRLGLPILYDAHHTIRGVRELVNAGLAFVQDPQDNWRVYRGPSAPLPAEVSDDRLATMVR